MAEMEKRPWHFTIEFDDEKAKKEWIYNVDDLYDCVGKVCGADGQRCASVLVWQAKEPGAVQGRSALFMTLSKQPW